MIKKELESGGILCHHSFVKLAKKHRKVLDTIYLIPTRATIRWQDFVALVYAVGGTVEVGGKSGGSRRRFRLNGTKAVLHKPHPQPEMKKGSVASARDFLRNAGITPETVREQ